MFLFRERRKKDAERNRLRRSGVSNHQPLPIAANQVSQPHLNPAQIHQLLEQPQILVVETAPSYVGSNHVVTNVVTPRGHQISQGQSVSLPVNIKMGEFEEKKVLAIGEIFASIGIGRTQHC